MGDDEEVRKYQLFVDGGDKTKSTSKGFSGQGRAEYPNADKFEGTYVNGIRKGKGTYTYADGTEFTGLYDGVKTGLGRVKYAKKAETDPDSYYHGYFVNGMREGQGTFKYPNGDMYSGEWKAGKKHGQGTYVYGNTKYEYKGQWVNGQIVQGTWSFTDGTKYVGGFQSQKPCGDGVWQTAKGTVVEGAYVQQVVPVDSAPVQEGKPPLTETRTFWKTAAMSALED